MKQQKYHQDMQRLADLEAIVQDKQQRDADNGAASKILGHIRDAGVFKQDGDGSFLVNAVGGVHRFDVDDGLQEIVVDFQDGGE